MTLTTVPALSPALYVTCVDIIFRYPFLYIYPEMNGTVITLTFRQISIVMPYNGSVLLANHPTIPQQQWSWSIQTSWAWQQQCARRWRLGQPCQACTLSGQPPGRSPLGGTHCPQPAIYFHLFSCLRWSTWTLVAALSPTLYKLYFTTMSIPSTRYLLLICKFRHNNNS